MNTQTEAIKQVEKILCALCKYYINQDIPGDIIVKLDKATEKIGEIIRNIDELDYR
jgi:hypothetical protein